MPERDDLARDRGYRLAVAENADFDFDAVEKLLDEHLVVVAKREGDRVVELGFVVGLADPDGRAEPRGLDEARIAERVLGLVALAKRDVFRDRQTAVAQHLLEEVLVHAEGGRGDACADVRHAGKLEQALHRPVLAERAVENREHDIDRAESGRSVRRGTGKVSATEPSPEPSSQRPSRPIATVTTS